MPDFQATLFAVVNFCVLVSKIILIILIFIIDFQATLFAVVNWVEAKSASHVQAWNVS